MKYVLIIIGLLLTAYTSYVSFSQTNPTLLQQTTEHNRESFNRCFQEAVSTGVQLSDTERYRTATDCWKSQRKFTPSDLYLTVPKYLVDEGKCSISQSEDEHVRAERWGMYATDLACKFEGQGVYAPDYLDQMIEYKIESIWTDNLLGNFVILSFNDSSNVKSRWYFWHTMLDSKLKIGDTITTWVRFARADLSGATTGWHTHIELRRMYDGVWQSVRYVTRLKERKLEEKRLSQTSSWQSFDPYNKNKVVAPSTDTYYFTHYDLWDEKQNDSTPCIGADGKDSCKLHSTGRGTMALTVDIRNKMWIKFWDKVVLTGEVGCEGVYTVTDEMACRFRGESAWANGPCYYSNKKDLAPKISNITRKDTPYFIKWDLPGRPGGACSIRKL